MEEFKRGEIDCEAENCSFPVEVEVEVEGNKTNIRLYAQNKLKIEPQMLWKMLIDVQNFSEGYPGIQIKSLLTFTQYLSSHNPQLTFLRIFIFINGASPSFHGSFLTHSNFL